MTRSENLKIKFFKLMLDLTVGLESKVSSIFREFDLTFSQSLILFQIYNIGQVRAKDLAKHRYSTKGAISQMLNILEAKNLIKKIQSTTDKRDWFIELTPNAHTIMNVINDAQKEKMEFMYDQIDAVELVATVATLERMRFNLSKNND